MKSKSTENLSPIKKIPAGVSLGDNNIEFVGEKNTKTCIWIQFGAAHSFEYLPKSIYKALKELFLTDDIAVKEITNRFPEEAHDIRRLVEIYTYYMYGQLDCNPDVVDGVLQRCENLRDTDDCVSLSFLHKVIDIEGVELTNRDLHIIDGMANGLPDKMIAHRLGVHPATLDFHKRSLYKRIGACSKTDAVVKAFKSHVIC